MESTIEELKFVADLAHNGGMMQAQNEALTAEGKRHLYLQYEKGGHGFGIDKHKWLDIFLKWIR